jgi:hypothetical protein
MKHLVKAVPFDAAAPLAPLALYRTETPGLQGFPRPTNYPEGTS